MGGHRGHTGRLYRSHREVVPVTQVTWGRHRGHMGRLCRSHGEVAEVTWGGCVGEGLVPTWFTGAEGWEQAER